MQPSTPRSSSRVSRRRSTARRITRRLAPIAVTLALGALACGAGEAIEQRVHGLRGGEKTEAPRAALPAALEELLPRAVRRRGANEAVFEVDSFVVALAQAQLRAGDPPTVRAAAVDGGYALSDIGEKDGLPALLGLQEGDIVQSVNGVSVLETARARVVLEALDGGATLELERDGVALTHEYLFVDGLAWAQVRGVSPDAASPAAAEVPDFSVELEPPPDPFAAAEARAAERAGGRAPGGATRPGGASRPASPRPSSSGKAGSGGGSGG
ncbi:MAG: hypothetical protein KC468_12665, partial [Myxococcales bacterium]|nr:hypothetical protein [Myxococcales bacterium]